jgi:hypothetical protein
MKIQPWHLQKILLPNPLHLLGRYSATLQCWHHWLVGCIILWPSSRNRCISKGSSIQSNVTAQLCPALACQHYGNEVQHDKAAVVQQSTWPFTIFLLPLLQNMAPYVVLHYCECWVVAQDFSTSILVWTDVNTVFKFLSVKAKINCLFVSSGKKQQLENK